MTNSTPKIIDFLMLEPKTNQRSDQILNEIFRKSSCKSPTLETLADGPVLHLHLQVKWNQIQRLIEWFEIENQIFDIQHKKFDDFDGEKKDADEQVLLKEERVLGRVIGIEEQVKCLNILLKILNNLILLFKSELESGNRLDMDNNEDWERRLTCLVYGFIQKILRKYFDFGYAKEAKEAAEDVEILKQTAKLALNGESNTGKKYHDDKSTSFNYSEEIKDTCAQEQKDSIDISLLLDILLIFTNNFITNFSVKNGTRYNDAILEIVAFLAPIATLSGDGNEIEARAENRKTKNPILYDRKQVYFLKISDFKIDLSISILKQLCMNDFFPNMVYCHSQESTPTDHIVFLRRKEFMERNLFYFQLLECIFVEKGGNQSLVSHFKETLFFLKYQLLYDLHVDFKNEFNLAVHSAENILSVSYCQQYISFQSAIYLSKTLELIKFLSELNLICQCKGQCEGECERKCEGKCEGKGKSLHKTVDPIVCQKDKELATILIDLLSHLNTILPSAITLKNSASNLQNPTCDGSVWSSHPLFMLKVDIIKTISNLSFWKKHFQSLFKDALILVLDNCLVDDLNPYIRETSLFCIRNLTKENLENQKVIDMLESKSKPKVYL